VCVDVGILRLGVVTQMYTHTHTHTHAHPSYSESESIGQHALCPPPHTHTHMGDSSERLIHQSGAIHLVLGRQRTLGALIIRATDSSD
jgi:hypothetical protein